MPDKTLKDYRIGQEDYPNFLDQLVVAAHEGGIAFEELKDFLTYANRVFKEGACLVGGQVIIPESAQHKFERWETNQLREGARIQERNARELLEERYQEEDFCKDIVDVKRYRKLETLRKLIDSRDHTQFSETFEQVTRECEEAITHLCVELYNSAQVAEDDITIQQIVSREFDMRHMLYHYGLERYVLSQEEPGIPINQFNIRRTSGAVESNWIACPLNVEVRDGGFVKVSLSFLNSSGQSKAYSNETFDKLRETMGLSGIQDVWDRELGYWPNPLAIDRQKMPGIRSSGLDERRPGKLGLK